MIGQVADTAQQVSDESENVSAAGEEQMSSLPQRTETLAQKADKLQTLPAQFTTNEREGGLNTAGETTQLSRLMVDSNKSRNCTTRLNQQLGIIHE